MLNGASADPFADLQQVLAGRLFVRLDARAAKTMCLLQRDDSDSVITKDRFKSWYRHGKGRTGTSYFLSTAPSLMGALMTAVGIAALDKPLLIRLPAGQVPSIDGFPAWGHGPLLVWVHATNEQVELKVRTVVAEWTAPSWVNAPKGGPDEPSDLEYWRGRARRFVPYRPCPRCGTTDSPYRDYESYGVCERCGRSFELTEVLGVSDDGS